MTILKTPRCAMPPHGASPRIESMREMRSSRLLVPSSRSGSSPFPGRLPSQRSSLGDANFSPQAPRPVVDAGTCDQKSPIRPASPPTTNQKFGARRSADVNVNPPPSNRELADSNSMAQVEGRLMQHVESVERRLVQQVDSVEQDANQKIAKLIELTQAYTDRWEVRFAAVESRPGQPSEVDTSGSQRELVLAETVDSAILTSRFDDLERRFYTLERMWQSDAASGDLELPQTRWDRVGTLIPRIQLDELASQIETLEREVDTIRTHMAPTDQGSYLETLLRGASKDEVLTGVLYRISQEVEHAKKDTVRRQTLQEQRLTNMEEEFREQQKSSVALLEIKCLQGRLESTGLDVAHLRQALDAQAEKLGSLLFRVHDMESTLASHSEVEAVSHRVDSVAALLNEFHRASTAKVM